MDSVKDAADKAASAVDQGVKSFTSVAASSASAALARGCELWDTAKVCVCRARGARGCGECMCEPPGGAAGLQLCRRTHGSRNGRSELQPR
jgi:hypothetical protein